MSKCWWAAACKVWLEWAWARDRKSGLKSWARSFPEFCKAFWQTRKNIIGLTHDNYLLGMTGLEEKKLKRLEKKLEKRDQGRSSWATTWTQKLLLTRFSSNSSPVTEIGSKVVPIQLFQHLWPALTYLSKTRHLPSSSTAKSSCSK